MSVDFGALLSKPAGQAKAPEALPVGNYRGMIASHEYGDANKNKTPYVRLNLNLMAWPDDVEPLPDVDLSKRKLRRDLYMTEDAMHLIDKLLASCDIEMDGKSYQVAIPELVGKMVTVEVQQYVKQGDNAETANSVGKVVGEA